MSLSTPLSRGICCAFGPLPEGTWAIRNAGDETHPPPAPHHPHRLTVRGNFAISARSYSRYRTVSGRVSGFEPGVCPHTLIALSFARLALLKRVCARALSAVLSLAKETFGHTLVAQRISESLNADARRRSKARRVVVAA
jgi:hypothetical protein